MINILIFNDLVEIGESERAKGNMIDNARPKVSEQNGREEGKKCYYNRTKEICASMNATIMFGVTIGKSQ